MYLIEVSTFKKREISALKVNRSLYIVCINCEHERQNVYAKHFERISYFGEYETQTKPKSASMTKY